MPALGAGGREFESLIRDQFIKMIPQQLADYVRVYDNILTPEDCRAAVFQLETAAWEKHKFYDILSDRRFSTDTELDISWERIFSTQTIQDRLWNAIKRYIIDDFAAFAQWFDGWKSYSAIRYNRYQPGTEMRLHCDHIHDLFDGTKRGIPVLSIVGALNDNYIGGEFVMWEDTVIDIAPGSVLIFPSIFMYPHAVRPVTQGTRYTYVSWVY